MKNNSIKDSYIEHEPGQIGMQHLNVPPAPVIVPFLDPSTRGSSGVIDEVMFYRGKYWV